MNRHQSIAAMNVRTEGPPDGELPRLGKLTKKEVSQITFVSSKPAPAAPPATIDPLRVLRAVLDESFFEVAAPEKAGIGAVIESLAELGRQIEDFSYPATKARHTALKQGGPVESFGEYEKSALDYRSRLKSRRGAITAEAAPLALAVVGRALEGAQAVIDQQTEREQSRASSFDLPFVPSNTLSEIQRSVRVLEEFQASAERSPDLMDLALLLRILT